MSIPQVIAISKCTSGMSINLKKDVESSIGKGAGDLSLYKQKEFLLGRHPGSNAVSTKVIGKKLTFPPGGGIYATDWSGISGCHG